MAGRALRFLVLGAAGIIALYLVAFFGYAFLTGESIPARATPTARAASVPPAARAQTWGNPRTLADHFARHGSDFGARDAQEYAALAAQLLDRARSEGLPAKIDGDGTVRVYDSRTGAFGAYNSDGTTKTFFKPGSASYFARQPGRTIDLRSGR